MEVWSPWRRRNGGAFEIPGHGTLPLSAAAACQTAVWPHICYKAKWSL
jgi:hypothetical protein